MTVRDRLKVNGKILEALEKHEASPKLAAETRRIAASIVDRELIEVETEWLGSSKLGERRADRDPKP